MQAYRIDAISKVMALVVVLLSIPITTHAESVLQVLPTRVLMSDSERSTTVTLVNRGDDDGTYRLFFRNLRMDDDGSMEEITENDSLLDEKFADKMLRFSPRRVTVPARSKQTVRIVLRKPAGLEDGEYRSHLVFRKLKDQKSVLENQASENQIAFSLRAVVEVTIPVIVRQGELSASMSIAKAQFDTLASGAQNIDFTLEREGNRSIYGNVDLWEVGSNGARRNLGSARGLAVYVPNQQRSFSIELDNVSKPIASDSSIVLEYNEDPNYGGNLKASKAL
ncbi:MAG: molecular chaperone [Pseudomonadales bacterium]